MRVLFYSWIFLLMAVSLAAQDQVHLLAGYHYEGKILSETEEKVVIKRSGNQVAANIDKSEIWKIIYENGKVIQINESTEELEQRIGNITDQEALEEILEDGGDRETEVALYYLIRKGFQYEFREKNLAEFSDRFPNSKYRRELISMTRYRKKFKENAEIDFECKDQFTPEVADRETNLRLEFTDHIGKSRTLEMETVLRFIRTYGKGYKLKSGKEWKNEYEISLNLDDSPDPVVLRDQYKPVDDQGDSPHIIYLNNVAMGDLNLNGQINIRTVLRKDDGEYLIDLDIQVDCHHW